jgi:hypothetical protein
MTPPPGGPNGHHHHQRRQQVSSMESGDDAPAAAAARRRFNWKAPAIVLGNNPGACAAVFSILMQIRTPSIPESEMMMSCC